MEKSKFNQWQAHLAKQLDKDYKKLYYSAKYSKKKDSQKVVLSKS